MKGDDEIMAKSLLKGGKMLSKTCPVCGCPLFEVKGETLCVVCAEKGSTVAEEEPRGTAYPDVRQGGERKTTPAVRDGEVISLPAFQSIEETVVALCLRIRQEENPERILVLMDAVRKGIDALALLSGKVPQR